MSSLRVSPLRNSSYGSVLTSSVGSDDFPDVCDVPKIPLPEEEEEEEKDEVLEGYDTISFLPVSSDVMDLVNKYKHLVRKLDHYPRGEERTELIASIFQEIGSLISYGFNDMTSMNLYYELRDKVDAWVKAPASASCLSACTLV